jgi:hypothetical protein
LGERGSSPTTRAELLARELLQSANLPHGAVVLDPSNGSGAYTTTSLGLNFIGNDRATVAHAGVLDGYIRLLLSHPLPTLCCTLVDRMARVVHGDRDIVRNLPPPVTSPMQNTLLCSTTSSQKEGSTHEKGPSRGFKIFAGVVSGMSNRGLSVSSSPTILKNNLMR